MDYNISRFNAAVKAMEQKKAALENLVKLHLADWHAEPRGSTGLHDEAKTAGRKQHTDGLNESLPKSPDKPSTPPRKKLTRAGK